jgi:hypothetical protein
MLTLMQRPLNPQPQAFWNKVTRRLPPEWVKWCAIAIVVILPGSLAVLATLYVARFIAGKLRMMSARGLTQ